MDKPSDLLDTLPSVKAVLENLTIKKAGKRPQLTNEQKTNFANTIASILGVDPKFVDIRTLSDEKQTSRSISESNGAIRNASIPIIERIFVMRCTGSKETFAKISKYMDDNVHRAGGLALQIGLDPDWKVLKIYYTKEKEGNGKKLAQYFEVPFTDVHLVTGYSNENSQISSAVITGKTLEEDIYINPSLNSKILGELMRKQCVILQGPPGTGKTTLAKNIGRNFIGANGEIASLQFHAGFSYDDFVQGWRPSEDKFELCDGHFIEFCDDAATNPEKKYLMIIDEINRGNVSAIFGECFSLIESTKRGPQHEVTLAYREPDSEKREFYVPANVYLIGTMNTADRSLAIVDYALRRRFSFIDLPPAYGDSEFLKFLERRGLSREFIAKLADRMTRLNKIIREEYRSLGPGFEIGHSYFCAETSPESDVEWFNNIVEHEIAPLLLEYWYDDPDTARSLIADILMDSKSVDAESTSPTREE